MCQMSFRRFYHNDLLETKVLECFVDVIWVVYNVYDPYFDKSTCYLCRVNYTDSWGFTFLLFVICISTRYGFLWSNEVVPFKSQKSMKDDFVSWVDLAISITTYIFAREGSLENAFLNMGPSSDWGVLVLEEGKIICNEYKWCVNPFYECTFKVSGLRLPLNNFEI